MATLILTAQGRGWEPPAQQKLAGKFVEFHLSQNKMVTLQDILLISNPKSCKNTFLTIKLVKRVTCNQSSR